MVLNNCNMKAHVGLYGSCRHELLLYLKRELIFVLNFDGGSMGLAERVTKKLKMEKCVSHLSFCHCRIYNMFSSLFSPYLVT